jgi:hypothetical protein
MAPIAGVTGGTGLIYFGLHYLGGQLGTTVVYLAPAISWSVSYLLFRFNTWADNRGRQRDLERLDELVNGYLQSPELSEADKRGLREGLAQLKVHVARQRMERVRLRFDAPASDVAAKLRSDLQSMLTGGGRERQPGSPGGDVDDPASTV